MKKAAFIILLLGFIFSSSFAQQTSDAVYGDDVYYSASKTKKKDKKKKNKNKNEATEPVQQVAEPDSTSTDLPKSSTLMDDYNDYSYSARIKRFQNPEENAGYFDETYTDPANYDYTTQQETSSPNVNIYLGAGFGSYYGPSWSFGFGWGYDPWYYNWGWGYPYYNWYWGYNYWWYSPYYYWSPYMYGYWNGYYAGYWDGYYGYPYGWNSWEYPYGGNTYYGRRQPITSTGGTKLNSNITESKANLPSGKDGSLASQSKVERSTASQSKYDRNSAGKETNSKMVNPEQSQSKTVASKYNQPPVQQKYEYTQNQKKQSAAYSKTASPNTRQQQPTPKYTKPGQYQSPQNQTKTQNYTSPTYRQPKSSQEYLSPRNQVTGTSVQQQTRSGQPAAGRPAYSQPQRQSFTPSSTQRQQPGSTGTRVNPTSSPTRDYTPSRTTPSRSNSYSTPSRSNSYSSPSRSNSYSSPSRSSSPSYSSPSRSSSPSYSSPSRSSGGSSSGGSGGIRHR